MSRPFTLCHRDWLYVLPVCHGRVEFASLAREAVRAIEPSVVAVELPTNLTDPVLRAVERLPQISVIVCPGDGDEALYLPVEPVDAGIEALRSGRELGAELALVDLDISGYGEHRDWIPDPYALTRIGAEAYYQAYRETPTQREALDERREAAMAYQLQRVHAQHGGPVLLVCGMAHAEGVSRSVAHPQAVPFARPRRPEARVFNLAPGSLAEILGEAPAVCCAYELLREGPLPPEPELHAARVGREAGPFRVLDGAGRDASQQRLALLREVARRSGSPLDRLCVYVALFDLASERWERVTGESLRPWQRNVFARYSRNLALLSGRLLVDAYDFLIAVRGVGDENLLYEAYELLMTYPWQRQASDLPTVEMSAEELNLDSRRIRIRPRFRRPKRRLFSLTSHPRGERYAGEWLEGFDEEGFCSYPPEDLVIEGYGQFLRRKGKALIAEESARVEPFRSSILDGVDMRETLRHWATEHRIYVREFGRVPGDVGEVVVIFDEDRNEDGAERFPYRMTWLGEHAQESDMAFYSTLPSQSIVGPGITRCEYGGLMMSYPPRRLLEVWNDPDYQAARTKAEVLLLAALDYSLERFVVHVAAQPPRSVFKSVAERLDRRIVHVPIGQLSPQSLRRLRVFHILAGRSKRAIARDYIW